MLRHLLQTSVHRAAFADRALLRHAPALADRALLRRAPALRRAYAAHDKSSEQAPSSASAPEPAADASDASAAAAAADAGAAGAAGGAAPESVDAKLDALAAEVAEKEAAIAELNDRTLRVLAEMENVRAIARRDVDNAKRYGIVAFARGLLPVADNLGLALGAVPPEKAASAGADPLLASLYAGVSATETELLKVFAQHGLARYGAVGDPFDPEIHQAMYEAPSDTVDPGTVLDVTKKGYSIGERILRPAEVGVSKSSS